MATTNTLSDAAIRKAKPSDKPRKLSDGGGLYLELQPNGGRWWRLKYRFEGKEKRIGLGTYPEVTLADARKRRDEARSLVAAGTDPSAARKDGKAEQQRQQHAEALAAEGKPQPCTFEYVAREWLEKKHEPEVSPKYAARSRKQLEADVFPHIGRLLVRDITAPKLLDLLRKVEARGATDTAHRVKQTCGLVFRYAITTGDADRDPVPDLRGALATHTKRHQPISNVTLNAAMRRLGFSGDEMTAHGFRALARTIIVENLPDVDPEWIEAQLAHSKRGPLGSAYDRAQYLRQRRQMMQTWADYLDRLRDGAQVIPIRAA